MSWISIDGAEGVGKSTTVGELARRLPDAVVVPEFSTGPAGQVLAAAVRAHPHVISESIVGQSLLFMAEFRERCDVIVTPARSQRRVITDRGWLSKVAYQSELLVPVLGESATETLLRVAMSGIEIPDVTICLIADVATLLERLRSRGETRTAAEVTTLTAIQDRMVRLAEVFRAVVIDTTGWSEAETVAAVLGELTRDSSAEFSPS